MPNAETTEHNTVDNLADAATEKSSRFIHYSANAVNTATDKVRDMGTSVDGCVRGNPWMAVGIAAGAGVIIGLLLRGRRSK